MSETLETKSVAVEDPEIFDNASNVFVGFGYKFPENPKDGFVFTLINTDRKQQFLYDGSMKVWIEIGTDSNYEIEGNQEEQTGSGEPIVPDAEKVVSFGFHGFDYHSNFYRYMEVRDWDRPVIYTPGIDVSGRDPSVTWPVDGYVIFELVFEDNDFYVVKVGGEGGTYEKYEQKTKFEDFWPPCSLGEKISDTKRYWNESYNRRHGGMWLYNDLNEYPTMAGSYTGEPITYDWEFVGRYINTSTTYSNNQYWYSDVYPKSYDIGTTGLGPFDVDVEVYANGKSDDCLFVFEGSDPLVYQNYPDAGQNENGYVWYTYKGKGLVTSYNNEKIATIPAGKIFSVMVVDMQEVDVYWRGTITLKGLSSTVDLSEYKTSQHNDKIFMIRKRKMSDSTYVDHIFTIHTLPEVLTMEDGYEYEFYTKR